MHCVTFQTIFYYLFKKENFHSGKSKEQCRAFVIGSYINHVNIEKMDDNTVRMRGNLPKPASFFELMKREKDVSDAHCSYKQG